MGPTQARKKAGNLNIVNRKCGSNPGQKFIIAIPVRIWNKHTFQYGCNLRVFKVGKLVGWSNWSPGFIVDKLGALKILGQGKKIWTEKKCKKHWISFQKVEKKKCQNSFKMLEKLKNVEKVEKCQKI